MAIIFTFSFRLHFSIKTLCFEEEPTLSSQVKAVSGRLSGERFGGRNCAEARGAIVDIAATSVAIVAIVVVGEMLGGGWLEASGAIRAANRQRTENIRVRGWGREICVLSTFLQILSPKNDW